MKYLLVLLVAATLMSCDYFSLKNFDEEADMIWFNVSSLENDSYREIRIYGIGVRDSVQVPFDSTIFNAKNRNGTEETFPKDRGYGLGFFADSVSKIQNGYFKAVAVKSDFSLVEKFFGQIVAGKTHKSYRITLTNSGIVAEEM